MSDEDYKIELIELIKYYQQVIYNYRQFPNYRNNEVTWDEAERRLEEYTRLYCKILK